MILNAYKLRNLHRSVYPPMSKIGTSALKILNKANKAKVGDQARAFIEGEMVGEMEPRADAILEYFHKAEADNCILELVLLQEVYGTSLIELVVDIHDAWERTRKVFESMPRKSKKLRSSSVGTLLDRLSLYQEINVSVLEPRMRASGRRIDWSKYRRHDVTLVQDIEIDIDLETLMAGI